MKYRKILFSISLILMVLGQSHAEESKTVVGDSPEGLTVCFHDAAHWVKMKSSDTKTPEAPLVRVTDKDGKTYPDVVEPLYLYLSLDRSSGKILQGLVASEVLVKKGEKRSSTEQVQVAEVKDLTWSARRLSGKFRVTVGPHGPLWNQVYPAVCTLEIDVTPGTDGKYQGRYGDFEVNGKVTAQTMTTPDLNKPCETTLYLYNAVSYRNKGGGPASCGGLAASWKDGRITTCAMGDCYGYNIWDMTIVDNTGLTLRDGKLSGVLIGKETSGYKPDQAGDIRWTIDAVIIGNRVLGTGRAVKTPTHKNINNKSFEYDIVINGLIDNTTNIPDVKSWRLDHEIRNRAEKDDPSYWHGRNPKEKQNKEK